MLYNRVLPTLALCGLVLGGGRYLRTFGSRCWKNLLEVHLVTTLVHNCTPSRCTSWCIIFYWSWWRWWYGRLVSDRRSGGCRIFICGWWRLGLGRRRRCRGWSRGFCIALDHTVGRRLGLVWSWWWRWPFRCQICHRMGWTFWKRCREVCLGSSTTHRFPYPTSPSSAHAPSHRSHYPLLHGIPPG